MIFKKQSPNGHVFLATVEIDDKVAEKIIKDNAHKKRGGWYTFDVRDNEVIVGNNLWNALKLNAYPEPKRGTSKYTKGSSIFTKSNR